MPDSGFNNIVRQVKENTGANERIIPQFELEQIMQINKELAEFIAYDIKSRSLQPEPIRAEYPHYLKAQKEQFIKDKRRNPTFDEMQYLREAARADLFKKFDDITNPILETTALYLDSVPLWKHKFSTSHEPNRHTATAHKDSLYYVTPAGLSLRLKRTNAREEGMKRVVQPFMERIVFMRNNMSINNGKVDPADISNEPKIGWWVQEYSSQQFWDIQNMKKPVLGDYKSTVDLTPAKDDTGKIMLVEPQNVADHFGSQVNNIFF